MAANIDGCGHRPTVRDRVVQAALKTVLEPIPEADFKPCSYGLRPGRRVQDPIAEIHFFTSRSYKWIVGGRHQRVLRRKLACRHP